jgi:hypothetical protein
MHVLAPQKGEANIGIILLIAKNIPNLKKRADCG